MKALMMLAMLAAPSAWGESFQNPSTLASQDPLMRQILHRQLTQNNGGITAAVRLATGQSIELQVAEQALQPLSDLKDALISPSARSLQPLAALKPVAGLAASLKKPSKSKPVKDASEQLRALEGKGRAKWPTR